MAEKNLTIQWTDPALSDLNAIADFIALDKPEAAVAFVRRVFAHVERLEQHPALGGCPPEMPKGRYRQIVEPPCRIFYRISGDVIYIVHVMRGERPFYPGRLDSSS